MVNDDSFFSLQYFKYYDVQRVGASGQKHIVPRYIIVYVDTWVVKSARRGDRLNCCMYTHCVHWNFNENYTIKFSYH